MPVTYTNRKGDPLGITVEKGGCGEGLCGFYVCPEHESWVFKFTPCQKWRALFGWSSAYKGQF